MIKDESTRKLLKLKRFYEVNFGKNDNLTNRYDTVSDVVKIKADNTINNEVTYIADVKIVKSQSSRPKHGLGCKKGLFPTRPSSISLKFGIMRDFSKKQRSIFNLGQKASNKKTTGLPTFQFSTISPSYFL
jgi:hypothetical protein